MDVTRPSSGPRACLSMREVFHNQLHFLVDENEASLVSILLLLRN